MSLTILKELLSKCRTEYLKLVKNKTSIFGYYNSSWRTIGTVDIRDLDTIILDKEKKTVLLEDIKSFINFESRAWYSVYGIPY